MNIPYNMIHIWIGPNPAPIKWMQTWKDSHPKWTYRIFDNAELNNRKFYNQHLIDEYYSRGFFNGVSDLIRYEILYEEGGFIPEADSVCLNNTEDLFTQPKDYSYSVFENEVIKPGYVSPVLATNAKNNFLENIIEDLHKLEPSQLKKKVWESTGNQYLKHAINKFNPKIKIFPSHYFIPEHYSNKQPRYSGSDKIYCEQMWGSTKKNYNEGT